MSREEAVYYREIQKNAYLKRIIDDGGGKVKPPSHKRALPKAMWTVFCVHNGRTPYLEQYSEQEDPSTLAHRPLWRANLERARHVTASVRPWPGGGYDFLVATDAEPVRMLAPDWDTMQDWVTALRGKLHELQVLGKGENVYGGPPVAPLPRAGFRDPTSPLPPTPVGPAIRVPGIEPIIAPLRTVHSETVASTTTISPDISSDAPIANEPENAPAQPVTESTDNMHEDASSDVTEHSEAPHPLERLDWDRAIQLASSSTDTPSHNGAHATVPDKTKGTGKKIAKICGQNICLDESILTRQRLDQSYTDDDFFAELDQINTEKSVGEFVEDEFENGHSVDNLSEVETLTFDERIDSYKVEVAPSGPTTSRAVAAAASSASAADVSGEDGGRTNVVDGEFKQRLVISEEVTSTDERPQSCSNVTVIQVSPKHRQPHTAIPIVGTENVFDFEFSQLLNNQNSFEVEGPNSDTLGKDFSNVHLNGSSEEIVSIVNADNGMNVTTEESPYGHVSLTTTVQLADASEGIYEKLFLASTSNGITQIKTPLESLKLTNRKTSLPNLETLRDPNPVYEYLCPLSANPESRVTVSSGSDSSRADSRNGGRTPTIRRAPTEERRSGTPANATDTRANGACDSVVPRGAPRPHLAAPRIVERSHSQSSYDATSRLVREKARNILGRNQNHATKRESGSSKDHNQTDVKPLKALFRRGLTELSFLTKLKTLANKQTREQQKPEPANTRQDGSPAKVARRARPNARACDSAARRRSTSLSGPGERAREGATPLRVRQAAALRAEQSRGAAVAARLARADADADPPAFADAQGQVWVAAWGRGGSWFGGRAGDRVAAVRGARPVDAAHARTLLRQSPGLSTVDILFHRVPHAKIYILYKEKDDESIGLKLDGECCISRVEAGSPAARAGLPPPGPRWAVTEINNRPINLLKGGDEDVRRLSTRCEEVSLLLQPLPLVQTLRTALKSHRVK